MNKFMKTYVKSLIPLLSIIAATLLIGCSPSKEQPPAATASEKSAEPESRVKRGTNGEVIVTLDAATRGVMGLETSPLAAAQLRPEVKGFGHVLDVAPLVGMVADLTAA